MVLKRHQRLSNKFLKMEHNCSHIKELVLNLVYGVENFYSGQQRIRQIDTSLENNIIREVDILNEYVPQRQTYLHIEVHKQHVPNLCGYHASFNLLQGINALKQKKTPEFQNMVAFWSYVRQIQNFLREFSRKSRKDLTAWPWREEDLNHGDFERTYLQVMINHQIFKNTFADEIFNNIKYTVFYDDVFFQYGNIINGSYEKEELQAKIDKFLSIKATPNHHILFGLMLGVTNHWVSFIALKNEYGTKFYLMDSRNRDYMKWNEQEMLEFLNQENIERQKRGQPKWNQFYLDLYTQGMKDIQLLNILIVSWLTGQTKIDSYCSNQRISVFLNPLLQDFIQMNTQEFFKLQINNQSIAELNQGVIMWADQYRETIYHFVSSQFKDISQQNKNIFLKAYQLLEACISYQIQKKEMTGQYQQRSLSCLKMLEKIKTRL